MTDLQKQKVTEMRESGCTYADISAALSLPIGTIKAYFSRNPTSKTVSPALDIPHEISEKPMDNCCKYCGEPLVNTPGHRQKTFCSAVCQRKFWQEHRDLMRHPSFVVTTCPACGHIFSDYAGHKRKYCSHTCYIEARYRKGDANETERNNLSCHDETFPENG